MKLTDHIKQLKDFYKAHGELDVVVGDAAITGLELGAGRCIVVTDNPITAARVSVFDERVEGTYTLPDPDPSEVHATKKPSRK